MNVSRLVFGLILISSLMLVSGMEEGFAASKQTFDPSRFLPKKSDVDVWIQGNIESNSASAWFTKSNLNTYIAITEVDIGEISSTTNKSFYDSVSKNAAKVLGYYEIKKVPISCIEYISADDYDSKDKQIVLHCLYKNNLMLYVDTADASVKNAQKNNHKYMNQIISKINTWNQIAPSNVNIDKYKIKLDSSQPSTINTKNEPGFSNTTCSKDGSWVTMRGKFTNGNTSFSSIYFKMAVIGYDGSVLATGIGTISNIGAYQTKIFDANAKWGGSFKSCEIEVDTAFK